MCTDQRQAGGSEQGGSRGLQELQTSLPRWSPWSLSKASQHFSTVNEGEGEENEEAEREEQEEKNEYP
jgi:hypothetical protein